MALNFFVLNSMWVIGTQIWPTGLIRTQIWLIRLIGTLIWLIGGHQDSDLAMVFGVHWGPSGPIGTQISFVGNHWGSLRLWVGLSGLIRTQTWFIPFIRGSPGLRFGCLWVIVGYPGSPGVQAHKGSSRLKCSSSRLTGTHIRLTGGHQDSDLANQGMLGLIGGHQGSSGHKHGSLGLTGFIEGHQASPGLRFDCWGSPGLRFDCLGVIRGYSGSPGVIRAHQGSSRLRCGSPGVIRTQTLLTKGCWGSSGVIRADRDLD